ncbi:2Fe-2S iron-sulfur cluster-binding protein [Rhizobacter sp. P5_C2]
MSGEDAALAAPTSFEAVVEPSGFRFAAPARQGLVKSAQLAGLRLPSSCRNGTCRACICKLVSGRVEYAIDWPGLSADEKAEGFILPCVAQPRSDLVIDAPAARPLTS